VEPIAFDAFPAEAEAFDAAVAASADIDRFCSSTDWILPAYETWGTPCTPWLRRGAGGWLALLESVDSLGRRALLGFDVMWGFSCPVVGAAPADVAAYLREQEWRLLLLQGLTPSSMLFARLVAGFGTWAELGTGETLTRWVASLAGGVDGFLGRRTAKFRENLRRARRRAADAGVVVEAGAPDFTRIVSVERRSWKGPAGTGLISPDLRVFYERMVERLGDRTRCLFARRDGVDVGYILGGVRHDLYRGLQFSFDESCADLSLGHVLQIEQIEALCEEGIASYDLGIDMEYKRHWADESISTVTLAVLRP
jgi:hypothetical protein